ncbi:MAG: CHAP domain-containing protein [Bacteroidota bacterium]
MIKHIEVAISQLDVQEAPKGSNWGEPVQSYLKSVGITFPASWCMAFVYWCCKEAYGKENKLFKTGGVLKQWQSVNPKHKFKTPLPGDIFIQDHGKGLGHTGFVEKVQGDQIFTIEGNTNDTGSREGYEVCRRFRKISSCIGFIRIV